MGKFLFRYRSYTPLILSVTVFIPFVQSPTLFAVVLALLLVGGAEGLRLWAVKYATGATRTRQSQTHPLCTTGPYAIVRNPLYVANILLYATAAGLLTQSWGWSIVSVLIFGGQYLCITLYECQQCGAQFGVTYATYVTQVPAWIPRWPYQWHWDQVRRPSLETWGMALRNERRSLTAVGLVWVIFLVKYWVSL